MWQYPPKVECMLGVGPCLIASCHTKEIDNSLPNFPSFIFFPITEWLCPV